jgi:hypothetical protein
MLSSLPLFWLSDKSTDTAEAKSTGHQREADGKDNLQPPIGNRGEGNASGKPFTLYEVPGGPEKEKTHNKGNKTTHKVCYEA